MTVATVDISTDNDRLRGRYMENAATVEQTILKAVFDRFAAVAVDLTNLSYMDSVLFDLASRVVGSRW
jgi:hypothetical protein